MTLSSITNRFALGFAILALVACGGGDGSATDDVATADDVASTDDVAVEKDATPDDVELPPVTCAVTSPVTGLVSNAAVQVTVTTTGGATQVVLFANGAEAARVATDENGGATFAWTAPGEGDAQLMARALRDDGAAAYSSVVVVTVDLTAPVVSVPLERFTVVQGSVAVTATVTEAHPDALRLVADDGTVLASAFPGTFDLLLDSTGMADGPLGARVEAIDLAGNVGASAPLVLVVANGGEQLEVEYIPMAKVAVPENWQTAEYHTRVMSEVRPGVKRILAWVTWDPSGDWQMEYSVGQGTCPHNGIQYTSAQSRAGEIVIDLARVDLSADVVAKFPAADQATDVFPVNDDPATFGSFFSHVAPLDPADHVGQSVDILAGTVVFYQ